MRIFINPGHAEGGVPDPGAVHEEYGLYGIQEYKLAREIGSLLAEYLEASGEEVRLLQSHNLMGEAPSYPCVVRTANEWPAQLFLSIHINAGGGRGCETLCYGEESAGARFATDIQHSLYTHIRTIDAGYRNRGVKVRPELAVLRGTAMPAALVEVGFLDSIDDAWLMTQYPEEFARALACGILAHRDSLRQ